MCRIDPDVAVLLESAPELTDRYLALVEDVDGDPGAVALFAELADYVSGLVGEVERHRPSLLRCLAGVEAVARVSEDAEELIVWAFFDNLSPDTCRRLGAWLGPRTRSLLDEVDHAGVGCPWRTATRRDPPAPC